MQSINLIEHGKTVLILSVNCTERQEYEQVSSFFGIWAPPNTHICYISSQNQMSKSATSW